MQFIFIPGIKASQLYDGDNRVWFPKNQQQLKALKYTNKLKAPDVLSKVSAFGKIPVRIYQGLIESFSESERDIWPYDWRQSIDVTAQSLASYIEGVAKNTGDRVTLVAHSMGGMIAKLAIHNLEDRGIVDETVAKLISIGTPWHGSPDALKTLLYGEPGIFEEFRHFYRFLDSETTRKLAAQFPSVYQLIPSEHYYSMPNGTFYLTNEGDDLPYSSVLSVVQRVYDDVNGGTVNVYEQFIKPIHEAMIKPLPNNVKHDCLIGHDVLTLYKVPSKTQDSLLERAQNKAKFKFSPRFGNGDSVVPVLSAKLDDKQTTHYYVGNIKHRSLLSSDEVLNFVKWSLAGGGHASRPAAIGIDCPDHSDLRHGVLAMVQCPIDLTVNDAEGRYVAGVYDPNMSDVSPLSESERIVSFSIGESTYYYISEDVHEDIVLNLDALDNGIADVSVERMDQPTKKAKQFDAIPLKPGVKATLVIPSSKELEETTLTMGEAEIESNLRDIVDTAAAESTPPVPGLSVLFKTVNSQKSGYRKVFSGDVEMTITSNNVAVADQIMYVIDNQDAQLYKSPVTLRLDSGEHTIKVFGKDIYKRPIPPIEDKISIDNTPPRTFIFTQIEPDGLKFTLNPKGKGSRVESYYQVVRHGESMTDQWDFAEANKENFVPWKDLTQKKDASLAIIFWSKNEFGFIEPMQHLTISLGEIPHLMWEDMGSYVTPTMIWANVFPKIKADLVNYSCQLLRQGKEDVDYDTSIPDDVRGVRFFSENMVVEVMFSERYSLYFNGPPTEVLAVGNEYRFSFQLRTDRSKYLITNSAPRARLHRIVAGKKATETDRYIDLKSKYGEFHGEFIVDESFREYKYKLIITDQKHVDPPLRVVPLILTEEGQ